MQLLKFFDDYIADIKQNVRDQIVEFFMIMTSSNMKIVSAPELLIDPAIRKWVFVPIVLITFFVDTWRQYVSILVSGAHTVTLQQIEDSQILFRAYLFRENGPFLPIRSYLMRKDFFNNERYGMLRQKRPTTGQNASVMISEMVKGNLVNMLPMVAIGGWINWMFSGFVTTKVPFPLTLRFKPMLQRGIELMSLDPSWVSSASWYFLNVFGLRSVYSLLLGETQGDLARKQSENEELIRTAMQITQNSKVTFKSEWEAVELCIYYNILKVYDKDFIRDILQKTKQPKSI